MKEKGDTSYKESKVKEMEEEERQRRREIKIGKYRKDKMAKGESGRNIKDRKK
jgi:hypothetical protein